jgi:hypothetical protein
MAGCRVYLLRQDVLEQHRHVPVEERRRHRGSAQWQPPGGGASHLAVARSRPHSPATRLTTVPRRCIRCIRCIAPPPLRLSPVTVGRSLARRRLRNQ